MYQPGYLPQGGYPGGLGHAPTYGPSGYYAQPGYYGYGAVDLWPQLRPRLRELMGQFNKDPKVAEPACRAAQEMVRGLNSSTELQNVINELLYDLKRQHPQIRKMRFRFVCRERWQTDWAVIKTASADLPLKEQFVG